MPSFPTTYLTHVVFAHARYGAGTIAKASIPKEESHRPDLSRTGVKEKMAAMLAREQAAAEKLATKVPPPAKKEFKWKVDHKVISLFFVCFVLQ